MRDESVSLIPSNLQPDSNSDMQRKSCKEMKFIKPFTLKKRTIAMDWNVNAKVEPSSTSGAVNTPVSIPNDVHCSDLATDSQFQTTQNIAQRFFEGAQQTLEKGLKGARCNPWTVKEDLALMSSWCFASDDKSRGNLPKGTSLWSRVVELFERYRAQTPDVINSRNLDQMKGRYKRLNENVSNWIAAYEEAHHLVKNGMINGDVLTQAHVIYTKGGYNKKFSDSHVFEEIMSKHPKWKINLDRDFTRVLPGGGGSNKEKRDSLKRYRINEEQDQDFLCTHPEDKGSNDERHESSKRLRTKEDGKHSILPDPETPSEDSTIPRLTGGEAAEEKENIVGSSSVLNEFLEEVREFRLARKKEAALMSELRTERMELELKKEERKVMKLHVKLLIKLLGKSHLSQEEEEFKSSLISAVMKK